eukprot:m.26945 g.26945  ORF g.26945 m.26945 type:complete len:61 (+) comp9307_c2_seq4:255-437(+)
MHFQLFKHVSKMQENRFSVSGLVRTTATANNIFANRLLMLLCMFAVLFKVIVYKPTHWMR